MTEKPKAYHWTPVAQRRFIEALADTGSVRLASAAAGKSPEAAYKQRRRSELFAVGWGAALAVARAKMEGTLMAAAMEPIALVPVRNPDTGRIGWRRADPALRSGMGLSLLQRLDRATGAIEPGQREMARAAEGDFEPFLDLVEQGPSRAEILDFLFKREKRAQLRIQCQLPQNSATSAPPAKAALAHRSPPGHPLPHSN